MSDPFPPDPFPPFHYLCLVAALLSHRLPRFLALNEPEASPHSDLLEPLAKLIAQAARGTQIWIVTHSEALAGHLPAQAGCTPRRVVMQGGVTLIEGLTMGVNSRIAMRMAIRVHENKVRSPVTAHVNVSEASHPALCLTRCYVHNLMPSRICNLMHPQKNR